MTASENAPPRARWPLVLTLCSMWCGLIITENISNQLLPLTLRRFTDNAATIGYILAINPLFGFIANPLVGVLSDRIWTPLGRRAVFLVTGAPIVAVCLWLVPEATLLWRIVVLVVIYQFFQDVLWGSDHPLLADLVPAEQRSWVGALIMVSAQVVGWAFNHYGIGYALDRWGESSLYRTGAIAQVTLVAVAALFLRERRTNRIARPPLSVRRYLTDFLGDPILRKFAALGFTQFFFQNIVQGMVVLFAVETMRLSPAQFGRSWSWVALMSLSLALPFGVVAERWMSKQWALVGGYSIAVIGCVLGCFARTATDLTIVVILFSFCLVAGQVTQKAFFTEYLPRDLIGQLSGTYNICLALGRTTALAGGGWLVHRLGNDYWWIWPIAIVAGLATIGIAVSIPDRRYQERRAAA